MAFASQLLSLLLLIFGEYLSRSKESRESDEATRKEKLNFESIAATALEKMRERNRADRKKLSDMQDEMDKDLKK